MVFAKNDIGFVFGNTRFLKCKVSLRKNANWPFNLKDISLSKLINPSFTKCKDQIVCFCDGIETDPKIEVFFPETFDQEEIEIPGEHEPLKLDNEFENKNALTISDIKEERCNKYHAEKLVWVKHHSNNDRLVRAIEHGYECDDEYCLERLTQELEGFFIADHTTYCYKASYPSEIALTLEDDLKNRLHGSKSKYGTQIKICLLEKHNGINYNDIEAIIVINYLGKFDIIGIIDTVAPTIYEQQRQSERFGSEVFSD